MGILFVPQDIPARDDSYVNIDKCSSHHIDKFY